MPYWLTFEVTRPNPTTPSGVPWNSGLAKRLFSASALGTTGTVPTGAGCTENAPSSRTTSDTNRPSTTASCVGSPGAPLGLGSVPASSPNARLAIVARRASTSASEASDPTCVVAENSWRGPSKLSAPTVAFPVDAACSKSAYASGKGTGCTLRPVAPGTSPTMRATASDGKASLAITAMANSFNSGAPTGRLEMTVPCIAPPGWPMENAFVVQPGGNVTVHPWGDTNWFGCGDVDDSGCRPVSPSGESQTIAAIASTATTPATTPAPRRERCGSGSGPTDRRWIESHRSGIGRSPSGPSRSFRSRIVVLQQLAEPPPAFAQVHVDRGSARADRGRPLGDGPVGVVVQHHGQTLVRRELPEGHDHVRDRVRVLVARLDVERLERSPALELARRHAERDPPHPARRLTQVVAAGERPGERFGHRVLRDRRVAGERQERPPDRGSVLSVDGREPGLLAHVGGRHIVLGIIFASNL